MGTADLDKIRETGFEVMDDPTANFPNHGRLTHPTQGAAGFNDENLKRLAQVFTNKTGL